MITPAVLVWFVAQAGDSPRLPPLGDLIGPGSAIGLLLAAVWMIMTDRLVPGRRVAKIEQDRDYWRTLALRLLGQHDQLLAAAEVSAQALSALPAVAETGDRG
jgi:hypothetical protein